MNQILCRIHVICISGSAVLGGFTAPNKQLLSVKSVLKSFDHVSNTYEIHKVTIFYEEKNDCLVWNRFL